LSASSALTQKDNNQRVYKTNQCLINSSIIISVAFNEKKLEMQQLILNAFKTLYKSTYLQISNN